MKSPEIINPLSCIMFLYSYSEQKCRKTAIVFQSEAFGSEVMTTDCSKVIAKFFSSYCSYFPCFITLTLFLSA